jgi:excisionase family DNA binding protein
MLFEPVYGDFGRRHYMNEERLLKLPEVAAKLALSRTAIYRLMARGELQPIKIGGSLRFPASTVDALIAKWKGEAPHASTR